MIWKAGIRRTQSGVRHVCQNSVLSVSCHTCKDWGGVCVCAGCFVFLIFGYTKTSSLHMRATGFVITAWTSASQIWGSGSASLCSLSVDHRLYQSARGKVIRGHGEWSALQVSEDALILYFSSLRKPEDDTVGVCDRTAQVCWHGCTCRSKQGLTAVCACTCVCVSAPERGTVRGAVDLIWVWQGEGQRCQ